MQIDKVNFKGVYLASEKQFSPVQYCISKKIEKKMFLSGYGSEQKTPIKSLEKKGYDLVIFPAENEFVDVFAIKNYAKRKKTKDLTLLNECLHIGSFNKNTKFNPSEVTKKIYLERGIIGTAKLLPIIGLLALINFAILKDCHKINVRESNIENIVPQDSIEPIIQDTVKLLKK